MIMDLAETARLRINILRQLKAADPAALPLPPLLMGAKLEGFFQHVAPPDALTALAAALDHLCDPDLRFTVRAPDVLSNVRKWKITKAGRDYLETEGF